MDRAAPNKAKTDSSESFPQTIPTDVIARYSSLGLYWRAIAATWRTFGLGKVFAISVVRQPLWSGINRLAMALDNLLFPEFRRVEVKNPIFIIGHPRSGTTFLHRLLNTTNEYCVFRIWEIFTPALTMRHLARPVVRRWKAKSKSVLFPKETGHQADLEDIEEEELLFIHTGNTQFYATITPLAFSEAGFPELVWSDHQPPAVKRRAMAYLKGCIQRQIHDTGKTQVVAKMNYSGTRIRSMLEAFPDARFIYLIRSPLETIPSHLTLDRNTFDHIWSLHRIPEEKLRRYYELRYHYDVAYYRYMEDVIDSDTIPGDRLLVIPYGQLRSDLAPTIERIIEFTGLQPSPALREKIAAQSNEQKRFVRTHRNLPLETFGLTEQRVTEDLGFVFDKYGFPHG
ncbi:sulfotransferase family protein [Thiococcus pfennigii]|uniref:sulfotransferase family protein n=1 Tax=Thiococcus pfennigii TaxID=1057 RepID=UPI0019068A87|nr:sulfotransferase [Thiococcus pfennigii]MBK1700632.1 hypothetical protein [Thiococcus pfennigii]MBK1730760.1 hypothetical protein [Thiococcus pfennigii]